MRHRLRLGMKAWLVLLSLFSVVPVALFSAFTIYRLGTSQQAALTRELIHRTESVADTIEQRLDAMVAALNALAESDAALKNDVAALYRHAQRVQADFPEAKVIVLLANDGKQLFNTMVPAGQPVPPDSIPAVVSDVFRNGRPAVSDLYVGATIGQPTLSVNVPVFVDGRILYCLRMSVLSDSFSQLLARQEIPPNWTAILLSQTGTIIARNRLAERFVGTKAVANVIAAVSRGLDGVFDSVTYEGLPVKAAVAHVGPWPWAITIGVPVDSLSAALTRSLVDMAVGGVLLLAAVLFCAYWVSRHLARQVAVASAASAALGSGSAPVLPPTRVRELDELGAALGSAKNREDAVSAALAVSQAMGAELTGLVDELKRSQAAVAKEAKRFEAILKTSSDGIHVLDMNGNLVEASDAFLHMLGYSEAEARTLNVRHWDARPADVNFPAHASASTGTPTLFETKHRRCDGTLFDVEISARHVDLDGQTYIYASARDITARKAAEAEIQQLAFYDTLTQLPNRRLLLERLNQAKLTAHRTAACGALIFIDLDNFKTLNDTLGHEIGDLLLRESATRLRSCVREVDTVARLGGDEFVVMLEDLSSKVDEAAAQAEAVGEKILALVGRPCRLAQRIHHSTASLGVTLFHDKEASNDDLLKQADLAMYQAKAAGRNTMRFFDPQMQASLAARAALETDLRRATQERELFLHYQPQVERRGRLVGGECLVRWWHPQRGLVMPGEFIPLAEESDLILTIGHQVLEMACARLVAWSGGPLTHGLTLAVNVSARQLRHPQFVEEVRAVLDRSGVDPARLKLELTESMVLQNVADTIAKMQTLKALGISFSLDDFGTGYSSLAYLKQLPLSQIKIDRSFVRGILTDPNDAVIARTIIVLGKSLGLKVIAEGVEEPEQWEMLRRDGCDEAQGYLCGRPMAAEDFIELVKRRAAFHAGEAPSLIAPPHGP
jgi:diguanylate cyclase (GGDEF)-like protein/PAS domain S-box-containing protein